MFVCAQRQRITRCITEDEDRPCVIEPAGWSTACHVCAITSWCPELQHCAVLVECSVFAHIVHSCSFHYNTRRTEESTATHIFVCSGIGVYLARCWHTLFIQTRTRCFRSGFRPSTFLPLWRLLATGRSCSGSSAPVALHSSGSAPAPQWAISLEPKI